MKTIKKGKRIRGPVRWWAGIRLTCPDCKQVIELEKNDPVTFCSNIDPQSFTMTDNKNRVRIFCTAPHCAGVMYAERGKGQAKPSPLKGALGCLAK